MTGQLHGLFAACVSVAQVVVLATTQDQLNEAMLQSEVVSLVQVTFKASHSWSPTQLLNTDKRTWLDDPKLRRRLADLLHPQEEEEQLVVDQPVEINMARVVDDEDGGPLAKELSQILQGNSSGRSHHDEALTSQAPTLASQPTGAPTQAESASREEEDAKRLSDLETAERKHKIYRQRLHDEAEKRRQEATHTADGQAQLTAEQAAKKAAADRRYWEEVAREAKFRADEDLRAEREAEDSMKKAAEEEAKWEAVTGQDYSHEESVAQEDASFEDIDAEIAREEAETESRKQAEAEAEGARQKAEMEALKKSEAEAEAARQRAEAEAQRRAEAEAEAMRQKAALEARAASEAQQLAEAEAARKHAEADALAARQEAHAEAQARAAAQEAQRRAEAAEEAARLKAEAEAAAQVEAKARAEAAEEARRKAEAAAEQAQKHADAEAQAEAQAKAEVAKIWQKAEEQRAIAVREAREAAKTQAKMKQEAEKARKRAEAEAIARKRAEEEARAARRQEKAEADAKEQAAFEHAKQLAEEEAASAMRDAEKSIRKRAMAVIESEENVKAEQAHHRAQEEAKHVAEQEARRRAEEEARDRAAAEREQAEKAAQEARRQAEEESRRRQQEEERRQAVEEARKKAEQEVEAEADRRAEETRKLEEERQKAEEERHKLEQEKQQMEEEKRRRSEEEAKRRADEEAKQQAEEEAKRRAEEEARQRAEQQARREAKRKAEEEARRQAEAKARAEAEAEKARWEAGRLKAEADSAEVKNIVNSWEQARVCMSPEELESSLEETKTAVLHGLPRWHEPEVPSQLEDVTLAFLIQASWEEQLKVLRRTFDLLYSPKDLFLYTVDRERLETQKVVQILPNPLPDNVVVRQSAHSAYYVWPRVEIVLDGLRTLLLQEKKWDFAVHLSESDYPLHSLSWIRKSFAMQRNTNFIHLIPRCSRAGDTGLDMKRDEWYWWTQDDALASCGSDTDVTTVDGIKFPMQHLEKGGFRFAHGAEWMAITRELVKYALSPDLLPYRKMIGMHVGADEIFWQSLVLNIPGFKQNISQQGWYIRWGHGKTDHSPDTLTKAYEDDILKNRQRFFFMRKVSEESLSLLDDIASLDAGTDVAPGPAQVEQWEEWSKAMVPCDEVANRQQQQAAVKMRGWQGTKSRKQLLEVYKWYMQSQ